MNRCGKGYFGRAAERQVQRSGGGLRRSESAVVMKKNAAVAEMEPSLAQGVR